jgi:hypothetical protein
MKSETRMTNDERSPNAEARNSTAAAAHGVSIGILDLGIHSSFVIHHSSF